MTYSICRNMTKYGTDKLWQMSLLNMKKRMVLSTFGVSYLMLPTHTRAHGGSGHRNIDFPFSKVKLTIGLLYMIPKYTLRWRFFRDLGHQFNKNLHISEVRNPKKTEKLKVIAQKYNIDPEVFQQKAQKLIRFRIFLK